jgi:hypothetical protein
MCTQKFMCLRSFRVKYVTIVNDTFSSSYFRHLLNCRMSVVYGVKFRNYIYIKIHVLVPLSRELLHHASSYVVEFMMTIKFGGAAIFCFIFNSF